MMNKSFFPIVLISIIFMPHVMAEGEKIHTFERRTPWGVTVEKYSYYLNKGKQIQHGDHLVHYDDGNLQSKISYQHGEPHGLATFYYKRLKQKSSESTYVNGKLHGSERQWSAEGKVLFECAWKNDDPWNGRAANKSSSGTGTIESSESWTTYLYKAGKKMRGSKKVFTSVYRHQTPNQQPDMNAFIRWQWYSYGITSKYPYIDQLPPYEKVPFLIDWCAKRGDNADIAQSQLRALTRVNFGEMNGNKKERTAEIKQWKQWWQTTGTHRPHLRKTKGKQDFAAWKLIVGKRNVKIPDLPIVIPDNYELQLTFRSGDYAGVINETITLKRSNNNASLVRVYSMVRDGPKTTETWLPFSIAEADRLTRAVGYLIDHPWLANDEKKINRRFWEEQNKNKGTSTSLRSVQEPKVKGRESFHIYYAGATISLKDQDGNVWWNDDPWHWYGANEERYNYSAQPFFSTIYPFVVSNYPETLRYTKREPLGWSKR